MGLGLYRLFWVQQVLESLLLIPSHLQTKTLLLFQLVTHQQPQDVL
jgi:hypothetical protein